MNTLLWGIMINIFSEKENSSGNAWVDAIIYFVITLITGFTGYKSTGVYKKWKSGKPITEKDIEKVVEKSYEVVDKIESIKKKHDKKTHGKKKE